MNQVALLYYPILAFTPIGVMPYSTYDSLRRVTRREYDMNWYSDLELVDSIGACLVVKRARIVSQSFFAFVFGGMVDVAIEEVEVIGTYDLMTMKDRVLEFVINYPDGYLSSGMLDELEETIKKASTVKQVVQAFLR